MNIYPDITNRCVMCTCYECWGPRGPKHSVCDGCFIRREVRNAEQRARIDDFYEQLPSSEFGIDPQGNLWEIELKCIECRAPRSAGDALYCKACRQSTERNALRAGMEYALRHPMILAALALRWGLVGMSAAVGAQAGMVAAAICAIIGHEVSGWMAVKILMADDE